jgi:hypothetical protein
MAGLAVRTNQGLAKHRQCTPIRSDRPVADHHELDPGSCERDRRKKRQKKGKLRKVQARQKSEAFALTRSLTEQAKKGFTSGTISRIARAPRHVSSAVFATLLSDSKLRQHLLPNAFPRTFADISKENPATKVNALFENLLLTSLMFSQYADVLNDFVDREAMFFHHLLLGDLAQCQQIHTGIRRKFGESFWSIETGLLLGEQTDGVAGNRRFLAGVNELAKDNMVAFIASFLTQRIESSLSMQAYEGGLNWSIKDVAELEEYAVPVAQVLFRLSFHRCELRVHANAILNAARFYSLIDYYQTFRRIVRSCAGGGIDDVSKSELAHILIDCCSPLSDTTVRSLSWLVSPSDQVTRSEEQELGFEIDDLYYRGKFDDVIRQGSRAILHYPGNLSFYLSLASSAAYGGIEFAALDTQLTEGSLSFDILRSLHSVFSLDRSMPDSMEHLVKLAYVLDTTLIGNRLMAFWLSKHGLHHPQGKDSFLLSISPKLSLSSLSACPDTTRKRWRPILRAAYPSNVAVECFTDNLEQEKSEELGLYEPFRHNLTGAKLIKEGNINEAIAEFKQLKHQGKASLPVFEDATEHLVACYVANAKFADAANEIIEMYLRNPHLIHGVMVRQLGNIVRELDCDPYQEDLDDLCWALTYWLSVEKGETERDNYKQFVAVDQFLANKQCQTISEYLTANPEPNTKLIAFLHKVCTPSALKLNSAFGNTDDLENERIAILQFILQHDSSLRASVTEEIADLTKQAKLREAKQEVESSRIFVNDDGIRASLGDDHEETYERFERIRSIEDEKLRQQLDVEDFAFEKVITFRDLAFSLFCKLFESVNDTFVWNKAHGLQTYLSMRIRHGHLSAQLRGQFENLGLVTRKTGADSEYASNDFWQEQFKSLGEATVNRADHELKDFSRSIDNLVDEVNFQWIRIRDRGNPNGMLDYTFDEAQLAGLYTASVMITSYADFVQLCLDCLWKRTSELLDGIRDRIIGELSFRLTDLLAGVEDRMYSIDPSIRHTEFSQRVATCRTNIQREMSRFAEWFRPASSPTIESFDFALLVQLGILNVNRVSPNADFKPNVHITVGRNIDGQFFSAFYYIMFNLFDNVVQHSHTDVFRPEIAFRLEGESIVLHVRNELGADVDISHVRSEVERANGIIQHRVEDSRLQTEGKTGFVKICKSLRQDLRQPSSNMVCYVDDENAFNVKITLPSHGVLEA